MPFRKAVFSLAVLLLASVPLALGQGTYTQIDYPGASVVTVCNGIDSAGDIIGSFEYIDNISHGFLLVGGTYTTIDYPGARDTYLLGINDLGQIVGYTSTFTFGFLYDVQAQRFTDIRYPGAMFTKPISINNAGIVGGAVLLNGKHFQGFELIGTEYRRIAPPHGSGPNSHVFGITASGELLVVVNTLDIGSSYLLNQGEYRQLMFPGDGYALGINGTGNALVGVFDDVVLLQNTGFLYQNHVFRPLSFPSSVSTFASGVNTSTEVVGWFNDATFALHGFTWTPPADAAKK
jgi:uncharacterized membrane protein